LNWGCKSNIYKEAQNYHGSCYYHPGVWDHGSTGTKMVVFVKEFSLLQQIKENKDSKELKDKRAADKTHTVMWEPHWTCCRQDWSSQGTLYYYKI